MSATPDRAPVSDSSILGAPRKAKDSERANSLRAGAEGVIGRLDLGEDAQGNWGEDVIPTCNQTRGDTDNLGSPGKIKNNTNNKNS